MSNKIDVVFTTELKELIENYKSQFQNIKTPGDILKNIKEIVNVTLSFVVSVEKEAVSIYKRTKKKISGKEKHDLVMSLLQLLMTFPFYTRWISNPILSATISVIVQILNILFENDWTDQMIIESVDEDVEDEIEKDNTN